MEDDIGRHTLFLREFQAQCAQRLPQRFVAGRDWRRLGGAGNGGAGGGAVRLAQVQRAFAAQHRARLVGQAQCAVAFRVHHQAAAGHQLTEDGTPLRGAVAGADAEHAQAVMIEAADALVAFAEQHIDQVMNAETLAGAVHARHRLLRGLGAVPGLRRLQAVVAVAARGVGGLAEILEDGAAAAGGQFAQANHGLQFAVGIALVVLARLRLAQPLAEDDDFLHAVTHPGVGGQAVAPGAARFLVVRLDALRQRQVGDEAHIGLVYAHAEGDGGDDDDAVLAQEALLVPAAGFGGQAGVIRKRAAPAPAEPRGGLLDFLARQAIDDAGVVRVPAGEELPQALAAVFAVADCVADVGAVETVAIDTRVGQLQLHDDVALRRRVGGGGQGDARHPGVALAQHRQLPVLLAEIVPPLRHAMRLVYREQRQALRVEPVERARLQQAFRRDVEQVERAVLDRGLGLADFMPIQRRVQAGGAHAGLAQRIHLVFHQRDERRDDNADTVAHHRRYLVAQRLAAAGGHQHQRIAPGQQVGDGVLLLQAETGVAENVLKNPAGVGHRAGQGFWSIHCCMMAHCRRPGPPTRQMVALRRRTGKARGANVRHFRRASGNPMRANATICGQIQPQAPCSPFPT